MRLVDITSENWKDVIFLTTNKTITVKGSDAPYEAKGMPSLCEDHVASNALSIVESVYEDGWVIKAIRLILEEMKSRFGCKEVYLSTGPDNVRAKHVYEKCGFRSEHRMLDDEELYKTNLD